MNELCKNYENIDFLTELFNRKFCLEHLNRLIKDQKGCAVFIIDLNNFKQVNDVYGHDMGDVVLIEVGKRLKQLENDNLIFARFGGDEFAAIYTSTDAESINKVGEMISKSLEDFIKVSESEFTISASIGVSRYPNDSDKITDLLKLADMAMYHAKKGEITDSYLISNELNQKLLKRKKIETLLKEIDIENDLFLEYQPIFNLQTSELIGMEALVRWSHKTEGIIYPLDFIYVAEEIDKIKDITKWVFIKALKQIKVWNEKYNKNLKIYLNVSDNCIHNKIFFGNVKFMLEDFKVKPSWLAIELSEVSLSVSPEYMRKLLVSINDLGIDIYIQNFGTSAFKIADLKNFKINTIKIDKNYIHKMDEEDSLCIVKSMILMAHGLGLNVGAECVETEAQYNTLKELKCNSFQGFYKSPALSKNDFEKTYLS